MVNTSYPYAINADAYTLTVNGGTVEADPYMIYNKDQLDMLAERVNNGCSDGGDDDYAEIGYKGKHFKLGADIAYDHTTDWNDTNSEENNFVAIGRAEDNSDRSDYEFRGHFDGAGHVISGIRIFCNDGEYTDNCHGLFGLTGRSAVVENIILADTRITGSDDIGGIVGSNNGTVSNCHVAATVAILGEGDNHGGIAGLNDDEDEKDEDEEDEEVEEDEAHNARQLTAFNFNFGDGDATRISASLVKSEEVKSEKFYSLDGRRLDGKPTARGIYINNGRKVVVK